MSTDPQMNSNQNLNPLDQQGPQAVQPLVDMPDPAVPSAADVVDPKIVTPVIQGGSTIELTELNKLAEDIKASSAPKDLQDKTLAMVERLTKIAQYGSFSAEYEPVAKYVSWITKVPWDKYSADNLELENVKQNLDKTHFGLSDVKERILEYVSMLNLIKQKEKRAEQAGSGQEPESSAPISQAPVSTQLQGTGSKEMSRLQGSSSHAPIICFVGVQGIGKTSIAKSISTALGKQFVRISLGGLADVTELRGLSRGNLDAGPGQVVKALIRTGTMNPLILMDEVDKVSESGGRRSDVMAALLEILDPEQNSTFVDHYIDFPIDLSKVMFICTANNLGGISAALLDRLEIIRMSSYTDDEKKYIAKDYLLPKVLASTGVDQSQLQFDEDVWELIIRPLGFDAGIRQLERNLTTLSRKIAKMIVTGQGTSFRITKQNFREFIPVDFGIYS